MGKSGSGKTSMRSIIFANYIARDTRRLGATSKSAFQTVVAWTQLFNDGFVFNLICDLCPVDCSWCGALPCSVSWQSGSKPVGLWRVNHTRSLFVISFNYLKVLLQSKSPLKTWFCAFLSLRQDTFMENYFTSQRDNIFRNVEVLIYVFDVESRELEKDMHYYQSCLEAILQNSPDAKVFCLVHKMDLVQEDQRDLVSLIISGISLHLIRGTDSVQTHIHYRHKYTESKTWNDVWFEGSLHWHVISNKYKIIHYTKLLSFLRPIRKAQFCWLTSVFTLHKYEKLDDLSGCFTDL